jgi:hypothetical protein
MKRIITVTQKIEKEVEVDLTSCYYQKHNQFYYKIDGELVIKVDTTFVPEFGYYPSISTEKLDWFINRLTTDEDSEYLPCNQIDFINALSQSLKSLKL